MSVAYLDCFSGIAGDMCLGALIHAGAPIDAIRADLARLGLHGYSLEVERTWRDAMEGVKVDVRMDPGVDQPHRGLGDIRAILAASELDLPLQHQADRIFTRLAQAEAHVHGTTEDEVHFHEVGAIDAIVDIVGVVSALRHLGVDEVRASEITLGRGFASCAHGQMPVPVPATLQLLRGVKVRFSEMEGELVTPTGAAIVAALATRTGDLPRMTPSAIGYGFGTRIRVDGPPNALRVILGTLDSRPADLVQLETNLDDETGEVVGYLIERALAQGALDAYATPIQMKKSRPGMMFSALCTEATADTIEQLIFDETRTLGVRRQRLGRTQLERRIAAISTTIGTVRAKFARDRHGVWQGAPEYDDAAEIARSRQLPLRQVLDLIQREMPDAPPVEAKLEASANPASLEPPRTPQLGEERP